MQHHVRRAVTSVAWLDSLYALYLMKYNLQFINQKFGGLKNITHI